ncbi:sensor histidine kinase [Halobacillus sp. Marseille-Q1614]|uniref:sensor histidine kinase n=1 Tax=Halobacillus sp. Marseille-Q1614 TaxID=2709134 RepID=UPI00156FE97F|nr:ATP-binding protein [Halobacillus sp. Marseille-Q1614]
MKSFNKKELALLLFIIASASYITIISINQPFLGIEVESTNEGWEISHIKGESWADRQGVPLGAEVSAINDELPEEHYTVFMFGEIENANSFEIINEGETIVYEGIEQSSIIHWALFIILPLIFLVIVLWISQVVKKKVEKRFSAHLLVLFFLLIGLGYLSASGAVRDDLYSVFLNTLLFLLSPVVLIHFLYNYFAEFNVYWFSKKWFQSLYIIVLITGLLESVFLMLVYYPPYFYQIPRILLLLQYILLFFIIYRGLYLYKDQAHGVLFKYMAFAMSAAFLPYIVLYLIPGLTLGFKLIPLEVAAVFLLALPATFMYLVTRERLIDIDFYMGRLRYYAILSTIPSFGILIVIALTMGDRLRAVHYVEIYFVVLFMLILFLSVKEILDFRLQQYLFAARYSYQESMHRLAKDMKDQTNAVDLMKVLRGEISSVLNVRHIYIYSKHIDKPMYCVYDPIPENLLGHFTENFDVNKYDIGSIVETQKGFGVIVGFSLEKVTMLWCEGKKNFTALNRDEKTYLQTISHNANIAIENMNLIEDLLKELRTLRSDQTQQYPAWLSRLLFSIAENQRKQLSIDLHDTVLQEQLYLYRKMDDLICKREDLPKTLQAELNIFKESILDSIHLIRETCNELRPAFIEELGLVHAMENLIEQYQLRSNFTVYFSHQNFDQELDQERVLAIFRITQELLSNAMKHSEAKIVKLSLSNTDKEVTLMYSDNGQGMDYSFQRDLFSHIGLSGIEQRVHGLDGQLNVETAPNAGFKAVIKFPSTAYKEVRV